MYAKRILALILSLTALTAGGQTRFVFSPQWTAQAQFAGYYAAYELGFYKQAGLDVEIRHPFATKQALDIILSGQAQATTLPLTAAIRLVNQGKSLVNILQTSMNSSLMLISRFGVDPATMKKGKVLTWRAGHDLIARCMAKRTGLDYEWIEAATPRNLFIAGAADATIAMSYNEYFQLLQTGLVPPGNTIYRFSEHDYNVQEDGVWMLATDYAKQKDAAERFAEASRKGWEWVADHPEEALDIVMEYVRKHKIHSNRALQQFMLEEILRLQLDPDSGERTFQLRPDMVRKASDLMLESGFVKRPVTYKELVP